MGGVAPFQVKVYDEDGDEIQLVGQHVSWDWDDDYEGQLRISFNVYTPKNF